MLYRHRERGSCLSPKTDFLVSSRDYFNDLLEEVLKEPTSFSAHPFSKIYLTELLHNFLHIDSLFEKNEEGKLTSKMLSEQLFETQTFENSKKILRLKRIAETTLYVSGFFASSLNRKLINQSYYTQVGSMVYANLSSISGFDKQSELYLHLSDHFIDYVDVLTEVSHKANIQKNSDILELFGRYVDVGSKWAEKQLIQSGVPLSPLKKTSN
jgi:hypothetical protein